MLKCMNNTDIVKRFKTQTWATQINLRERKPNSYAGLKYIQKKKSEENF